MVNVRHTDAHSSKSVSPVLSRAILWLDSMRSDSKSPGREQVRCTVVTCQCGLVLSQTQTSSRQRRNKLARPHGKTADGRRRRLCARSCEGLT